MRRREVLAWGRALRISRRSRLMLSLQPWLKAFGLLAVIVATTAVLVMAGLSTI